MYLSYHNLKEKPFQISSDPRFLWFSEKHREALATLKYGIYENKGFLMLTGDIGTGKTTLINSLLNNLDDDIVVAVVSDPDLKRLDFFRLIAYDFDINEDFDSKGQFLIHFRKFLYAQYEEKKKVLLIIDESQRINQALYEEIRVLSNIEKQHTKLINIFFVGQQEFSDIILKPENKALLQRITINYNLDPLNSTETGEYIKYRLNAAGADRLIFNNRAIHEIFKFSNGYPRLINIICDHALLTAYAKDKKRINADIILECDKELRIKSQTGKEDIAEKPKATKQSKNVKSKKDPNKKELNKKDQTVIKERPVSKKSNKQNDENKKKENFLSINSVGIRLDIGSKKNDLLKFSVNLQMGNMLGLIVPKKDKEVIEQLKVGTRLQDVHFFTPIALLRGIGVISAKKLISSGKNKGDYHIDIAIESI